LWQQHLKFSGSLEATQEPTTTAGELIEEIRITQQTDTGKQDLHTTRVRLFTDREELVDEFPD
jgi:hypothetical protein